MATRKPSKPAPSAAPVTGLGETIEQITDLVSEKRAVLMTCVTIKKGYTPEQVDQAAYEYGIAERRRRKLARKVQGAKDEQE